MEKYKSSLIFDKYVVNEIKLKNNEKFEPTENKKIEIVFSIKKAVERTENSLIVRLSVDVFKDSEKNNYPFEITLVLTGYFKIEGEDKIDFEPNAIAILYPYVRTLVSSYTSSANIAPLILPVVNVNKIIEDELK